MPPFPVPLLVPYFPNTLPSHPLPLRIKAALHNDLRLTQIHLPPRACPAVVSMIPNGKYSFPSESPGSTLNVMEYKSDLQHWEHESFRMQITTAFKRLYQLEG